MGDIIEFTTRPLQKGDEIQFYKVNSHGFNFEVKSYSTVAIGLAENFATGCDLWIIIGNGTIGEIWIRGKYNILIARSVKNAINGIGYRRFWLTWRDGHIKLGTGRSRLPLLSYPIILKFWYTTFVSLNINYLDDSTTKASCWRLELPPVREKPRVKFISGGELKWIRVESGNPIPEGAFIGGFEKETLYIIRAELAGSLTPGKFVPSLGRGYISWDGRDHRMYEFEVLCGFDCKWVPSSCDKIPVNAVVGGYSEDRRETLFVGRALVDGHLITGKVQPSHKVCYVPYGGKEVAQKNFEVLVTVDPKTHSDQKLFMRKVDVNTSEPELDELDLGGLYIE